MNDDPSTLVGTLTFAKQQMIEIAKAVSYDADVIIMDEPTSSLTETEVERLFEIIKQLTSGNKAIIYIIHKMDEVFQICDEETLFRDGTYVGSDTIENLTQDKLITMMVGRELTDMFPKVDCEIGETVFEVQHLSFPGTFTDISFELKRGEILGFAGLVGAGSSEVMEAIFGMRPVTDAREKLQANGYDYDAVQNRVNQILSKKTVDESPRRSFEVIGVTARIERKDSQKPIMTMIKCKKELTS